MTRVGLLGYGYWGPKVARNLAATSGASLTALADIDADRLGAARDRLTGVASSQDPEHVIAATDVDAVIVATPLGTHFDLARAALEAGKHVLVEKPFTATSAQAEELVALAGRQERVLMVNHTGVYSRAVATTLDLIDDGEVGDLLYYDSVRISDGTFRSDEDVLWDLAVHDLGLLDVLHPGPPVRLTATGAAHPADGPHSLAHLTLFYDDGMIAHISASWLSPVKVRRILLGGRRCRLVFDDLETIDKLRVHRADQVEDLRVPVLDRTEPLQLALEHFADCVSTGRTPVSDGRAGLRIVRLLELASRSLAAEGTPMAVPG